MLFLKVRLILFSRLALPFFLILFQDKEEVRYDLIFQPYIEEINKSISNITVRLDSLEKDIIEDKEICQKSIDSIKTDIQLNKNMIQVMRRSSQIMFP